ncbi:ATP-binding protein [Guggenheimella bovis]
MKKKITYPFSAIVGQEDMKLALILNLINPKIGGVLIRGEKGTAKSTAVRGLCELMDEVDVVKGCKFHCRFDDIDFCEECQKLDTKVLGKYTRRVIELPISATEDRVVGSLNIEKAIREGEKEFEPGILAEANGNILYVDEINLLDDHIVDILLDSAAMGVNTIEREGVSYSHPARFVLVGTMNPEEGDLRPQLLDRFGLVVEVKGEQNIEQRSELIKRRMEFESNPSKFYEAFREADESLKLAIKRAQDALPTIHIPDERFREAAKIGAELGVDGHRADITLLKTGATLAAYMGTSEVTLDHLIQCAKLVLPHRMRRLPFEESNIEDFDWKGLFDVL